MPSVNAINIVNLAQSVVVCNWHIEVVAVISPNHVIQLPAGKCSITAVTNLKELVVNTLEKSIQSDSFYLVMYNCGDDLQLV